MNGIYHKVGIKASASEVFNAITTQAGLSNWWTNQVTGTFSGGVSLPKDLIQFTFGDKGMMDMQVTEVSHAKNVIWQCLAGPEDWIGSHIEFDLQTSPNNSDMTILYFRHRDWKNESEFTAHCSTKWAIFLMSLKSLVEKGSGQPFPNDVKIDDMN